MTRKLHDIKRTIERAEMRKSKAEADLAAAEKELIEFCESQFAAIDEKAQAAKAALREKLGVAVPTPHAVSPGRPRGRVGIRWYDEKSIDAYVDILPDEFSLADVAATIGTRKSNPNVRFAVMRWIDQGRVRFVRYEDNRKKIYGKVQ